MSDACRNININGHWRHIAGDNFLFLVSGPHSCCLLLALCKVNNRTSICIVVLFIATRPVGHSPKITILSGKSDEFSSVTSARLKFQRSSTQFDELETTGLQSRANLCTLALPLQRVHTMMFRQTTQLPIISPNGNRFGVLRHHSRNEPTRENPKEHFLFSRSGGWQHWLLCYYSEPYSACARTRSW